MGRARVDVEEAAEALLLPGELFLDYGRRAEVMRALAEKFPGVARHTLSSGLRRALLKRRSS